MKFSIIKILKYISIFLPYSSFCPYCGTRLSIFHDNAPKRFEPSHCPVCGKEFQDTMSLMQFVITSILVGICVYFVDSDDAKIMIVYFSWLYLFFIHNLKKIDTLGTIGEQLVTVKTIKNDVFNYFNTWDTYYIYFVDLEGKPLTVGYPIKLEYVSDFFTNVKSRISFTEMEPDQKFLQVGSGFGLFYNKQQIGKGNVIFYQKI